MWSGFSSEIETVSRRLHEKQRLLRRMWSGFSSEIETGLNQLQARALLPSRMWSGFSSEIETNCAEGHSGRCSIVACGAASRLRLKPPAHLRAYRICDVACGAASRLRLKQRKKEHCMPYYDMSHL